MRLYIEDHPSSPFVRILKSCITDHDVLALEGNCNVDNVSTDEISLVLLDITFDNPATLRKYNEYVDKINNLLLPNVIVAPGLCSEYYHIVNARNLGVADKEYSEQIDECIKIYGYKRLRILKQHKNVRNFEKYCKALASEALSDCAMADGTKDIIFYNVDCSEETCNGIKQQSCKFGYSSFVKMQCYTEIHPLLLLAKNDSGSIKGEINSSTVKLNKELDLNSVDSRLRLHLYNI